MTITVGRAEDELEELGIVELRTQLGRVVDEAYYRERPVAILRNGRRMAVIVPAEMWDRMRAHLGQCDTSAGDEGTARRASSEDARRAA